MDQAPAAPADPRLQRCCFIYRPRSRYHHDSVCAGAGVCERIYEYGKLFVSEADYQEALKAAERWSP